MTTSRQERSGWRQVDHTADLALELWAPSLEELLCTGARALIAMLTGGAEISPDAERTVELDTVDPEDQLVQWLNEVLYLAVSHGFLFTGADLRLTPHSLRATVRGRADARDAITDELKSVTYHDLELHHDDSGWRTSVVIDV